MRWCRAAQSCGSCGRSRTGSRWAAIPYTRRCIFSALAFSARARRCAARGRSGDRRPHLLRCVGSRADRSLLRSSSRLRRSVARWRRSPNLATATRSSCGSRRSIMLVSRAAASARRSGAATRAIMLFCLHSLAVLLSLFRRCDEQLRVGRADGGGGAEGEGEGEGEGLDYNASSSPCTS